MWWRCYVILAPSVQPVLGYFVLNLFLLTLARGSILDKRVDKTALVANKTHFCVPDCRHRHRRSRRDAVDGGRRRLRRNPETSQR